MITEVNEFCSFESLAVFECCHMKKPLAQFNRQRRFDEMTTCFVRKKKETREGVHNQQVGSSKAKWA